MLSFRKPSRFPLAFVAILVAGCGGALNSTETLPQAQVQALGSNPAHVKTDELITVNANDGDLEYWPIRPGGGNQPQPLSASLGVYNVYAMAADGNTIVIQNYSPAEIVTYDVKTKATATLADPYGGPVDVAIGKKGTIYALNLANVAVYKPGSAPSELSCAYVNEGEAIAVDNEGDVFVDGYGPGGFMGVVEYPAGSTICTKLHLRPEQGYIGGVGVDPKTDDLIVVDNPDMCAGGTEGRMIVYPKPYEPRTARRRILGASYCAGIFRLNADSTLIFVLDATVSDAFPLIDQDTYPGAKSEGTYQIGASPSGSFGGFTTIPNKLPN